MENNRGQSIFLSVVGIATLLVAIVGATFAYFSISVTGNEDASSIYVRTAKVGGVTYDGTGAGLVVTNAYPGYTKTKTFSISTDNNADPTASVQYTIDLVTTEAGLSSAAVTNKTSSLASDFVYSLHKTTSAGGEQADVTNAAVPATTGSANIGTGTLTGPMTHTYELTVTLLETGTSQNLLQGLTYEGKVQINVADAQGLRTWDESTSGWKKYTSADITSVTP